MKRLGAPAAAQRLGADHWLTLSRQQITAWRGLSLTDLGGQLTRNASPGDPAVAQATLDGKQVVVVSKQDGFKLYVANTGVADPLRADFKGRAGGRIDFMQYGADFRISAPDNPVDIGKLIDGG